MKLKTGGKAVIIMLVVGAIGFGIHKFDGLGYFNVKPTTPASVPQIADLPRGDAAPFLPGPTVQPQAPTVTVALPAVTSTYEARVLTIPWNGTLGLQYANGGVTTASGSLMAKRGVKLKLERQDMYDQMLAEQVKFAKAVAEGNNAPKEGAAFTIIMGDGYPAYIAGAQEALTKLGQQLEVVGAIGYSRGEDKCIIDAKANPKGSLIAAVLRDGDWNICVQWAADNGIAINPDEKVYDPNAMNFVAVDSFTAADEKFITGACETRPVVKGGQPTGGREKACVNGTATWTPGDVKVARERGNLRVLASTKEYRWQMPTIIIGNKQWMSQNRSYVENMLAAAFEGGELVRTSDAALTAAANTAAKVFNEETGEYWKRYFKGVVENDKTGKPISLGGSTTIGLGDNAYLFGLNGNDNLYKRIYTVFGNYVVRYYPDVMPKLVPYESVVNVSYVQGVLAKAKGTVTADVPTYTANVKPTGTFAQRSVSIEFETGKAAFTPQAVKQLNTLLDELSVSGLVVQLNGHTDSVGNPESNLKLSKQRADAVKSFLVENASSSFPQERIRTRAYGDTAPLADNKTAEGRAQNRRVEVQLLVTE